ncbi:MAG TPA: cation diffusion facilitator family transporter [Acidimicrobiia bacterium]|nr:cation diffusion facilitator family transporter [Acidimicrobiia bacterium]
MVEQHNHSHTVSPDAALTANANAVNKRREKRLAISLVLNLAIVLLQAVFGFIAHSIGLIADAGHNLTDVGAIALSLFAVRLLRRAPTRDRSYGFHRAGVLAAQANAATMLLVTGFIGYEAIRRLFEPEAVNGGLVVIVASIGALINFGCALALREGHAGHEHGSSSRSEDINIRSATLHLLGDGAASLGVVIAGLVIMLSGGWYWLDPAISLLIGLLIALQAFKLLKEANSVLLESTPPGLDTDALMAAVTELKTVEAIHDLHVWSLSSEMRALSAHVVLSGHPTLEEAQLVGNSIKDILVKKFAVSHATLELECESCVEEGDVTCLVAE